MKTTRLEGMHRLTIEPALDKYNARYDNLAFVAATMDKASPYANALIDEALALCGHPHYKLSFRNWSTSALVFLNRFIREEK